MPDNDNGYDTAAIRTLLLAAFTAEDLRRFCRDRPTFRPVLTRLSAQHGLDDIVDQVIDYCDTHRLFEQLLDAVREERPAQYAHYEPHLRASAADRIAVKILKPGSTLLSGRYRIVRHIGRGGFGSVYLAEDTLLREQVAIKELIPALVGDEAALKRFLVEGKATMQLAHPHIVRTRDLFEAEGNYYIVMEYLLGESLEDQIKAHKTLPVDDAVRILAEVCDGLAYAHARGVVHCDLKPANILLAADGTAKVSDFGVAHVSDQMVTKTWLTPGGFAGGTLPYMSPEQTDGVRDDPRIDVYALGAVLYRALTGRTYLDFDQRDTPRAQSDNVQRICTHQPVPPSSHNRHVPAWLDAVVLKALAKRPEDRYASVAELRSALFSPPPAPATAALPPVPSPASTQHPSLTTRLRRLPGWLLPAAGAALLVVILGIALASLRGGGQPGTTTPQATAMPATGVVTYTVKEGDSLFWLATRFDVPVAELAKANGISTTDSIRPGQVLVIPVPETMLPTPTPTATPTGVPALSPSPLGGGRIAFFSDRDGTWEIYVMNSDGTGQTRLTYGSGGGCEPAWSPDGRIAFAWGRDGNWEIYVMNGDGSNQTRLTNSLADDLYPAWSPDGTRIAFASARDGNWEIYVINADGSGPTRLTDTPADDLHPTWSPDGKRLAFYSDRDGNREIYAMNADGTGQTRLTDNSAIDMDPAWSPDGTRIAFASTRDGTYEIYAMNTDGAGQTPLTYIPDEAMDPAWSPDGKRIAFGMGRDGTWQIHVMNADGSNAVNLTDNRVNNQDPAWWPGPPPHPPTPSPQSPPSSRPPFRPRHLPRPPRLLG